MRNLLHSFTISIILIGLLIGYAKADYNYDPFSLWNRYYYAWDKTKDIFLVLCVIFPLKSMKWPWVLIGFFFFIRSIWQIFAIQDYSTASRPSIIFSLFLVEIVVICFIMFFPLVKRIKWHRLK